MTSRWVFSAFKRFKQAPGPYLWLTLLGLGWYSPIYPCHLWPAREMRQPPRSATGPRSICRSFKAERIPSKVTPQPDLLKPERPISTGSNTTIMTAKADPPQPGLSPWAVDMDPVEGVTIPNGSRTSSAGAATHVPKSATGNVAAYDAAQSDRPPFDQSGIAQGMGFGPSPPPRSQGLSRHPQRGAGRPTQSGGNNDLAANRRVPGAMPPGGTAKPCPAMAPDVEKTKKRNRAERAQSSGRSLATGRIKQLAGSRCATRNFRTGVTRR